MQNGKINSYRDLVVWRKSILLVKLIYQATENFPKSEIYSLTSQIRRSAVSIPSNIAEGSRRGTRKDFRNFLLNAYGSGAELETQIEIAKILGYIKTTDISDIENILNEIMGMLNKLISNLSE